MIKKVLLLILFASSLHAETYKWQKADHTSVQRGSDLASIPNDPGNRDWQAFQVWVASGNVVTEADPPPTPAQILAALRAQAIDEFNNAVDAAVKRDRAIMLVLLDEINVTRGEVNVLRKRDRDRTADIAASSSLADLKTRWAARPSLSDIPDRTVDQAKTAFQNKMNSGAAD